MPNQETRGHRPRLQWGILLDIEGTTTPIRFVYEVLFPYARRRLETVHISDELIALLNSEHSRDVDAPPWQDAAAYALWLMDRDRKSTALKELQGQIWQEGYRTGELHGEVFPDVPPALQLWHESGVDVRIFSSGSVLAQKLLFSSTPAGDLTRFLNGYYDTTTGPKTERASYERIAAAFEKPAANILFVSDVVGELDAASESGMQTLLCLRPGNHPQPAHAHATIATFEEITLDRFSPRG